MSIFSNLKCYGCANFEFALKIWIPKVKEQHVKNHEKKNVLNLIVWIRLMAKHWPYLLFKTIFFSLCVLF
jgi:hypothetical protein